MLAKSKISRVLLEWLVVSIAFVLLAAVLLVDSSIDHQKIREVEKVRISTLSGLVQQQISHQLEAADRALTRLAEHYVRNGRERGDQAKLIDTMEGLADAMTGIRVFFILDASGTVQATTVRNMLGRDFSDREYFAFARNLPAQEQFVVAEPFRNSFGVWTMILLRTIRDEAGGFGGIVFGSVELQELGSLLEATRYEPDVWTGILHPNGTLFVARPDNGDVSQYGNLRDGHDALFSRHFAERESFSIQQGAFPLMGSDTLLAFRAVNMPGKKDDAKLFVGIGRSTSHIDAPWRSELTTNFALLGALFLVVAVSLFLIQRRRRMEEASARTVQLALSDSEARLRTFVANHPGIAYAINKDGIFTLSEGQSLALLGLRPGQVVGQSVFVLYEDSPDICFHVRQALAGKICTFETQIGDLIFESWIGPLTNAEGEIDGVLGISSEISARKGAEAELARQHDQLEELVEQRTATLVRSHNTLSGLLRAPELSEGLEVALSHLLEQIAGTMVVARAGIWQFCQASQVLQCRDLWEAGRQQHWFDLSVSVNDYPGYFAATLRDEPIIAVDAHTHPATVELSAGYLKPLSIASMLDIPIHVNEKLWGVLCLEHTGKPRNWSVEDVSFAVGVAALVALVIEKNMRREAELGLIEAKEAAEAANIAKSAFLANMSHEIRTPLNAITGMVHILRRTALTTQQIDKVDKIENAGSHLLRIINDILDLSKIEAGKFVLEDVPVHVEAILGNVTAMLGQKAREKGLRLLSEVDSVPHNLQGDPTRLQQALLNYVANAIKFTESGQVALRVRVLAQTSVTATLRFEVEDSGIGIPSEALTRLFGVFEQADQSTTRKYGGTGLGLAITKKIAEVMGGSAGVNSVVGQGSTFWFTAVLRKSGETAEHAVRDITELVDLVIQREHAGKRVLLVEDEPINREIALMLLEDVGLSVDLAEDGRTAVNKASSNDYDLILMDMQMPVLNGLDATRQIRQLPGCQAIPILAMTANAFAENKEQCFDAGMDDFIAKPVVPEVFYATLLNWLGGSGGDSAS